MIGTSYKFHSDPGHGWLEVSLAEVCRLGILEDITSCSYVDDTFRTLYLEEDCDADLFLRTKENAGETVHIVRLHTDDDSHVRGYHLIQFPLVDEEV